MDRLKAMQTFVRIVEANSFSKAAETLDLPRASLTATLQNLESFLGTKLLQRTTRRLSLTADGAEYYKKCIDILGAIDDAEQSFRGPDAHKPKGKLRIDLPATFGRKFVMPQIARFCSAYPDVHLGVTASDRFIDLMQEGVDCAVRIGELQDSSMIGRKVGSMRFVTCASPSYLSKYGAPKQIGELQGHQGVVHFSGRTGRAFDWDFVVDGKIIRLEMTGTMSVNDADIYVSCGLQGLGLIQAAAYQVREHIERGDLVELFPDWPPTPMPISLLYPQGRMAAPKLRVFADWLTELVLHDPDLR